MELWQETFWRLISDYGLLFLVVLVCFACCLLVYFFSQKLIHNTLSDAPTALLQVSSKTGKVLFANSHAQQILGIRLVGSEYYLPRHVDKKLIRSFFDGIVGSAFHGLEVIWPVSSNRVTSLIVSGRRSFPRARGQWILSLKSAEPLINQSDSQGSLEVLQSAFDSLSELVYIKNQDDELLWSNRAYNHFWLGRAEQGVPEFTDLAKGRQSKRRWTTSPDGDGCLIETFQSELRNSEGKRIGVLGISHDVTDWFTTQQKLKEEIDKRKNTEVALAQRDSILQNILQSSPDCIGIFDEHMVYLACNLPFVKALGIAKVEDLVGKRLQDVLPGETYQRMSESDRQVLHEGRSLRFIDQVQNSDGQYSWFDVVKSPLSDPSTGKNGVLILARDVTERYRAAQDLREANQELERLSFIDSLTQIANRRRFDTQLSTFWRAHTREAKPLSVMLCDIDYYKQFNDIYGHQAGDNALKLLAEAFESALFRSTDLVARYGGEEFAFIMPYTPLDGGILLAEKVHHAVKKLVIEHTGSLVSKQVTVSIGLVCIVPKPSDEQEMILALADSALYQAKSNGRNQTCVHHTSEH